MFSSTTLESTVLYRHEIHPWDRESYMYGTPEVVPVQLTGSRTRMVDITRLIAQLNLGCLEQAHIQERSMNDRFKAKVIIIDLKSSVQTINL